MRTSQTEDKESLSNILGQITPIHPAPNYAKISGMGARLRIDIWISSYLQTNIQTSKTQVQIFVSKQSHSSPFHLKLLSLSFFQIDQIYWQVFVIILISFIWVHS